MPFVYINIQTSSKRKLTLKKNYHTIKTYKGSKMILILKNENLRNLMTNEKGTLKFLSNREHAIIAKLETENTVVIVNASDRIN